MLIATNSASTLASKECSKIKIPPSTNSENKSPTKISESQSSSKIIILFRNN